MSITDDDLETTNSAIAKLEGIEPSGDLERVQCPQARVRS